MMRYTGCFLLLLAYPAFAAEPIYSWHYRADDPDRTYLYRDGTQIGGWCYRTMQYRPFDGQYWGDASNAAPVQPPARMTPAQSVAWQPTTRRPGPIGRRLAEGMAVRMAPFVVDIFALAMTEAMKAMLEKLRSLLYVGDAIHSAKLFSHIEMGGKLNQDVNSADYRLTQEFMNKGSANVFLSERRKLGERMKEEKFSHVVLKKIAIE